MKKLLLLALLVVGCTTQKQITPSENEKINLCDDILYIQTNPYILKDCFPNYTLFGIGIGTSRLRDVAEDKAKVSAEIDLRRSITDGIENYKRSFFYPIADDPQADELDSLLNPITISSGVIENSIILKTFISKEGDMYKSIVIIAGNFGK